MTDYQNPPTVRRFEGAEFGIDGSGGAAAPPPTPAPQQQAPVGRQEGAPMAAPAALAAPPAADKNTVVFTGSYLAHGEAVRAVEFREPSTSELRRCGYPLRQMLNADTGAVESIEINAASVAKYIPLLSRPPLPASTVDELSLKDFDNCAGVIVGFFLK